jgi:hypothetical protein
LLYSVQYLEPGGNSEGLLVASRFTANGNPVMIWICGSLQVDSDVTLIKSDKDRVVLVPQ